MTCSLMPLAEMNARSCASPRAVLPVWQDAVAFMPGFDERGVDLK